MDVVKKIEKAIRHLEEAKEMYEKGDKRKVLYHVDHAKDEIPGVIYTVVAEMEEDEVDENG